MNSLNYILQIPTLVSNIPCISSYNIAPMFGSTTLNIILSGDISVIAPGTAIRKLVYYFSTEINNLYTIQFPLTGITNILGLPIQYNVFSTQQNFATYSLFLSGIRENYTIDTFILNLSVFQINSLSSFNGLSLIDASIVDASTISNNLLINTELNSTGQLCQFILPANILDI